MTCPTCGAPHGPGDAFCARCGTPLRHEANQPSGPPAPPPMGEVDPAPLEDHDLAILGGAGSDTDSVPAQQDPHPDTPTEWISQSPPEEEDDGWYGRAHRGAQPYERDAWQRNDRRRSTATWVVTAVIAILALVAIGLAGMALTHRDKPSAHNKSSGSSNSTRHSGPTSHPPSAPTPLRTKSVRGAASGTEYAVKVWAENRTTDCAGHAYGSAMVKFLKATRCTTMTRRLVSTTVAGKPAGFAVTAITFRSAAEAARFTKVVNKDGTGNLTDLLREGKRIPGGPTSLPSPDAFSSVTHGAVVTVVDAFYLGAATPTNDPPLTKLAADLHAEAGVGAPN